MSDPVKVAMIRLGLWSELMPIYEAHPGGDIVRLPEFTLQTKPNVSEVAQ